MEDRFRSLLKEKKTTNTNKKQKHKHPNQDQKQQQQQPQNTNMNTTSISFKPSSDVKGLKFGGQFIIKSFTVRRASPIELSLLLNHDPKTSPGPGLGPGPPFPSTISYIPTNFTILAHHAWHTLTLGLGTNKSKVIIFVFDTVAGKLKTDLTWPTQIPLGEINKRLIKGLNGTEMARFKFRKGCVTFYVFGVRKKGEKGFYCGQDLRDVLHSVVQLRDFLDHTAMLALPNQRSISNSGNNNPVEVH